jgi:lipoprotein-anchoring transpeptidase ErfK/SrfK
VPDAAPVVALYTQSAQHAQDASTLSGDRRSSAEANAAALVAEAGAAVEASAALARTIHLGSARRTLLARAHSALTEASVYAREGDFGTATVRARHAIDLAAQVRDHAAAVAARYADAETVARWRRWHAETIAWSRREGRPAIIVAKEAHTLTLYVDGVAARTYRVDLGFNWIADKSHAGDGATPEGRYKVVARKANGASIYYKALLLDYPNQDDRVEFSQARRSGAVPSTASIGGLIEIHGEGGRGRDWTKGCVALTNAEIDELFARVGLGTPVTIVGSDNDGAIAELGGRRRTGQPERRP